MSHLRVNEDHWHFLLNHHLNNLPKSPFTSPQRRCVCNLSLEEREEVFKVQLNIRDYNREDIIVRSDIINGAPYIIVEGKKKEENGVVPGEFIRRYPLPLGVRMNDYVQDICSTGILTVTAYKRVPVDARKERVSPSRARYEVSQVARRIVIDIP